MAHIFDNRVLETSTSTGTGALLLDAAVLAHRRFGARLAINDTCHYMIQAVDALGRPTGQYEYGRGTYSAANTLARTIVVGSSSADALVDFAVGTKQVSLCVLAPTTDQLRADWRAALDAGASIDSVPAGFVGHTAASAPPPGWIKRNGTAVSRTVYAALFAAIGTTFGAGDGSTTFNLPDDRANVDRGWDDGRGIDSGRVRGSEQLSQIEAHNHRYSGIIGNGAGPTVTNIAPGSGWSITSDGNNTTSFGGGETRMRNRAHLAIIKY